MKMSINVRVPADGSEPEPTKEKSEIHFARDVVDPAFGLKVEIDLPVPWEDGGKAKDTLKELDWEETHWTWTEEVEAWSVDMDALNKAVEHMANAGYDVTVSLDVVKTFEKGKTGVRREGKAKFLPARRGITH